VPFPSLAIALVFAQSVSFASGRPPECAGARLNAWERAKAPQMRAYCDLIASATSKIAGGKESARAALAETQEAEQLAPEQPYSRVLRGRALEKLGRAPEAYDAFAEAKKLDARALDDPQTLLSWSRVLARTKRSDEAENAYRMLLPRASWLDSRDRALAYVEAGLIVMQKGPQKIDEAVAIFRQARAEAQDSYRAVALVLLALALDRSGDPAQAQAVLGDRGDVRALFDDPRVREVFDTVVAGPEIDAAVAESLQPLKPKDAQVAWAKYLKNAAGSPWADHAASRANAGAPAKKTSTTTSGDRARAPQGGRGR
jgi:tetratricopeptide (TPR) repeat protein